MTIIGPPPSSPKVLCVQRSDDEAPLEASNVHRNVLVVRLRFVVVLFVLLFPNVKNTFLRVPRPIAEVMR
jgi:hypothetical protein